MITDTQRILIWHKSQLYHPHVVINGDVAIPESAVIEPFCVLGSEHGPLVIPEGSIIRSHSVIEGGSEFGRQLETGHYTLIRSGVQAGTNFRIGSYSSLEGGNVIGDYVRMHGRCEHTNGVMRHFSRMHLNSVLTDTRLPPSSTHEPAVLDEGAVLAAAVIVIAGVTVGVGSFVGACCTVTKDVPDGMALVGGKLRPVTTLTYNGETYPWTSYAAYQYPREAHERIAKLNDRIIACASQS